MRSVPDSGTVGSVPAPEEADGADSDFPSAYRLLVARRAAREPLQHILGVMWFRGLELASRPGVFIVRPETEVVAEAAVEAARRMTDDDGAPLAVDLCAGSGAIAVALAHEVPQARLVAVEIDEILASQVRTWFDLPRSPRLRIRVGDAAEVVTGLRPGQWDVVVRDVFNGGSVPASCRSQEFLGTCLRALAPDGLLLVNTASMPRAQAGAEIAALTRALDGDVSCAVMVADPAAVRGRRRGNLVLVARQTPFTASELEEVERAVRRLALPVRTWSLNDAAVPRPEGG